MTDTKKLFENFRNFVKEGPADDFEKAADVGLYDYTDLLKKIAKDPDFQKIARAGQTDGDETDEVVSVKRTSTGVDKLFATQAEIGASNSLDDQMNNGAAFNGNSTAIALGLKGEPIIMPSQDDPPPAILVWNGKYILDGHHRWSQIMMTNPTGKVAIDNVTGPALDSAEDALKITQLAIAIVAKNVVTKPFEGANLMGMGTDEVENYVLKTITDEVLALLVEAKKIAEPSKELAAQYYGQNHKIIQKRRGKFEREKGMPQAGKSGASQDAVNKALSTGAVNFKNPQKSDVK
jgi:hypothetical protein